MSQVSNGSAPKVETDVNPIPDRALLHFVALVGDNKDCLAKFLQSLGPRTEMLGEVKMGSWNAVDRPRPCTYTDLKIGQWGFRLIYDPEGLPPVLEGTVFAEEPTFEAKEIVTEHKASCLVFLTAAPLHEDLGSSPEGWTRFQALATLAWAWLDAGAELLCFPEARVYLPRRLLLPLEPELLTPDHAYLFVSNGVAETYEEEGVRKVWGRTWGMGQFSLPDLAAHVIMEGEPDRLDKVMESLRLFMETLPPAMVRDHGMLPVGGTIQLGNAIWEAVTPPMPSDPELPFLASRFGTQIFEQAQG